MILSTSENKCKKNNHYNLNKNIKSLVYLNNKRNMKYKIPIAFALISASFQLCLLPPLGTSEPISPYNKYTTRHTHISNITVLKINLIEGECWMNAG